LMPAVPMNEIKPVLDRIDEFCRSLGNAWGDRMLKGALRELKVHFLQRNIPDARCTDLDFILIRFEGEKVLPAALLEIKKEGRPLDGWQEKLYRYIASILHVPFYLLEANDGPRFKVIQVDGEKRFGPLTLEKLGEWMRSLINGTEFYDDDWKTPIEAIH
jgi:hypothetical protein